MVIFESVHWTIAVVGLPFKKCPQNLNPGIIAFSN